MYFQNLVVGDKNGKLHIIQIEGLTAAASLFQKYASGLSKLTNLTFTEAQADESNN